MKIMFEDIDNSLTLCEVMSIDNGVTHIDIDESYLDAINVDNVVRFTSEDEGLIYIVVNKEEGNNIIRNAYRYDTLDLTNYKDKTIFYPDLEDVEHIKDVINSVFGSKDAEYHSNQYGLYEY